MPRSEFVGKIRIVAGKYRGHVLPVLTQSKLRPTPHRLRETLFNWLQQDIADSKVLDAFAGTGALGIEALSRGARSVTLLESHRESALALRQLSMASELKIYEQDAWAFARTCEKASFDIIFLDPPFSRYTLKALLAAFGALLASGGYLYYESLAKDEDDCVLDGWKTYRDKVMGEVRGRLLYEQR